MENETDTEKTCPICKEPLESQGYDGDWEQLACTDDDCDVVVERAVSNPSGDGYTMEDLQKMSEYVAEGKSNPTTSDE